MHHPPYPDPTEPRQLQAHSDALCEIGILALELAEGGLMAVIVEVLGTLISGEGGEVTEVGEDVQEQKR